MNRRKLLKATGASLTTAPFFGVAGARRGANQGRSFEEHAAQARKIRERTGSQERFVEYHQRHADHVTNKQWKKKLPHHESGDSNSGGPSSEKLSSGDTVLDITVAYYLHSGCGGEDQAHIDLHADIDTGAFGDGGAGEDTFTLSWNNDHYRYEDDTSYIDGCDNCSLRTHELNGVSWDWNDLSACRASCNTSFSFGCYAELLSTDQERAIQAKHIHTWNELTIGGVSFSSSGGVVLNVDSNENWAELAYEIAEEPFDNENFC